MSCVFSSHPKRKIKHAFFVPAPQQISLSPPPKELDSSRNGLLMIGSEVPSAAQVKELKRRQERAAARPGGVCEYCGKRLAGLTLVQLWGIFGKELVEEFLLMTAGTGGGGVAGDGGGSGGGGGGGGGEEVVIMRRGVPLTMEERLVLAQAAADARESGDKVTGPSANGRLRSGSGGAGSSSSSSAMQTKPSKSIEYYLPACLPTFLPTYLYHLSDP
jgi:hypothetical protein